MSQIKLNFYNSTLFKLILISLISSLVIDISLGNIADVDIVTGFISSASGLALFVVISVLVCLGQLFLIHYMDTVMKEKIHKTFFSSQNLIKGITVFGIVLLFSLMIQIFIFSHYEVMLLIVGSTICWLTATALMIILSIKLISWYNTNRSWILLLYAMSAICLASYEVSMLSLSSIILFDKDTEVYQDSDVIFPINDIPGSPIAVSNTIVQLTYNLGFVFLWGSTALFLYGHVSRIGKWKYWTIMGFILVAFLSYLGLVFPELELSEELQEAEVDIIPGILFATYSAIAGGFLFGIGFLYLSRELNSTKFLKIHLFLAYIGFFIMFISNGATIFNAAYPPYGFVNVLTVPLSSYLVYQGILYSATSLSKDYHLRKLLKNSTLAESSLINKMGTAEREMSIKNIVSSTMAKTRSLNSQGVESSLTEENLNSYVKQVLRELEKTRDNRKI